MAPGEKPTVLIVDDDEARSRSLSAELEVHGFRARILDDDYAALEACRGLDPDLVVINGSLPRRKGMDLCGAVRRETHQLTPCLMIVPEDKDIIEDAINSGAHDLLVLPERCTAWAQRLRCIVQSQHRTSQAAPDVEVVEPSSVDSLARSGFASRRQFLQQVATGLDRVRDTRQHVAVMFMDVDRFKQVNESLGHAVGDTLLESLAERFRSGLTWPEGVEGHFVHFGGDEFAFLLTPLPHVQDAAKVGRQILEMMKEPFEIDSHEIYASVSIGISIYPVDHLDAESLLKSAETAMYHAKEQGRSNLQFYSRSMNSMAFERLTLETSLRKALEREELAVYYQPKVEVLTERIVGMEALIRWNHPDLGIISPNQFIPIAEETGLIEPIGEWVLETACRQCLAWEKSGLPRIQMAVNLSVEQMIKPGLAQKLSRIIRRTGLTPNRVELELTESMLMRNVDDGVRILQDLKRLGIRLAVDDFGTGYSSLTYLKRFPIDTLKIDRTFMRDIMVDPDDRSITTAILLMAHSLRLEVVAEGVESQEQLKFLRERNCDLAQGYLFSPPVPTQEATDLLAGRTALANC